MPARNDQVLLFGLVLLIVVALGSYIASASVNGAPQWSELLFPVLCLPVAAVAWFRATERESARALALGLTVLAAGEIGSIQENALASVFEISGAVGTGIAVWFCIVFPRDLPRQLRASWRWALVAALLDGGVRVWYVTSTRASNELIVFVVDSIVLLMACTLLMRNYLQVSAVGQRRMRWCLMGLAIGTSAWLFQVVTLLVVPGIDPTLLYSVVSVMQVAMPIGALVAVLADDALAIDGQAKIASVRAVCLTLVALMIIGGSQWLVSPPLVEQGVPTSVLVFATTVVVAAAEIAVCLALRRPLVHAFLPERELFSVAPHILQNATLGVHSKAELALGLGRALETIFRTSWVCASVLDPETNEFVVAIDKRAPNSLGAVTTPVSREVTTGERPTGLSFDEVGGAVLRMFLDEELHIIVTLGSKQSHSSYLAEERAFLGVAVSLASHALRLMETNDTVKSQRDIISSLRASSASNAQHLREEFARARHDLSQPVQAIRLLGELLENCNLDQSSRRIATSIALSTESMIGILRSVSPCKGKKPVKHAFRLWSLEQKLRALFVVRAEEKGVSLTIDLGPHRVRSHSLLLERILSNLISNAIRYTEKGHVHVTHHLDAEDSSLRLCVADSGPGIDLSRSDELFAPYKQLDNGSKDGLGLGLAIVAQTAAMLDHPLSLNSSAAGTTIMLRVPQSKPETAGSLVC